MCQLACDDIDWIMVDPYEALQEKYVLTAAVLCVPPAPSLGRLSHC
jgi:nicotinic acid mononucleotide adenylyltransferase